MTRYAWFATLLVSLPALGAAGARTSVRLPWAELAPAAEGKNVTAVLRDGARIEARVLAVEPEALRVKIRFSSEPKTWPERTTLLPRGSVSVIRIVERSRWWRAVLTPGVPALMLGAMGVTASSVSPTPDPRKVVGIGVGVALGSTVGGYYLGRRLDLRRVTEISVIPEVEAAR